MFPTIDDGVKGLAFIEAAVKSSQGEQQVGEALRRKPAAAQTWIATALRASE